MIELVDHALESRVRQDLTWPPTGYAIDFQPPGREGTLGDTTGAETVGIYLYDIREDTDRRQTGMVYRYTTDGVDPKKKAAEHEPPRWARLSYLITAWAPDAVTAHRMLGELLIGFARSRELPVPLPPELEEMELAALLDVGHPPAEDRALTELWSAVGHTLVPALNVTVTVPLLSFLTKQYEDWVRQPLVVLDKNVEIRHPGAGWRPRPPRPGREAR